jgi:hypothetical protein
MLTIDFGIVTDTFDPIVMSELDLVNVDTADGNMMPDFHAQRPLVAHMHAPDLILVPLPKTKIKLQEVKYSPITL